MDDLEAAQIVERGLHVGLAGAVGDEDQARVDAPTLLALRLVLLAAFVRVFLPLVFPALYIKAVTASGLIWAAAFAIWFAAHLRMLTRAGS